MKRNYLMALVADQRGKIVELDGFAAVGMSGSTLTPLTVEASSVMPFGGELMMLPDRLPIVYDLAAGDYRALFDHPLFPDEPVYPVAAFNSPGYVNSLISAYQEKPEARYLPLFSYGAVGWYKDAFRTPVIQVDYEPRQDLRYMKREKIVAGVHRIQKAIPGNRLREHLEKCALTYGCPAGKNFFLGRYEAPLPTSIACNARCLGCLSLQENGDFPSTQDRIAFTPKPQEIAEVALYHIERVKRAIVSFGQGCEGDPLLAAHAIEPALKIIRSKTDAGTINMNTNGSLPDVLRRCLVSGLDSVRISLNSVQEHFYSAYFRPKSYQFSDVLESIDTAVQNGKFVSINYFNLPGFTDTPEEFDALMAFLKAHSIHMIQWRNLNYDPIRYIAAMSAVGKLGKPLGMDIVIAKIRERFPKVKFGYFNPAKETFNEVSEC